jgi:hypothetical protein
MRFLYLNDSSKNEELTMIIGLYLNPNAEYQ